MRLKLLNGAPLSEHLDFSHETLLSVTECNSFAVNCWHIQSTGEEIAFKWRDIGMQNARLHTGWSQPHLPEAGLQGARDNHSFAMPDIERSSALPHYDPSNPDTTLTLDGDDAAADDYLQHSLIFYDTLMSSQVVQNATEDNTVGSSSFLTASFGTTVSGVGSPSPVDSHELVLQVPPAMAITPISSLPNARHLRSIYPQTPTPNFLCVLMTTPERREVFVRKGGYRMDLWEITVGDDTNSTFKVTFWLRPPRESNNEPKTRQLQLLHTLRRLQVGNILLLRNIALTSFRDTVYGQSLNNSITRARTAIDVLLKSSGMSVAQVGGLPRSVVETFMRVKRWARSHVAGHAEHVRKRKATCSPGSPSKRTLHSARDEDLPPDTMEDT